MEIVHEEPTNYDQMQTLTILEQIKEQHFMNDKERKTLEVIGQWSIVYGNMKKLSKSVGHNVSIEKVTPIQQKKSCRKIKVIIVRRTI